MAQEEKTGKRSKAIGISVFNEHVALPFSEPDNSPAHLGATVSYEWSRSRSGMYQFTHIFQGGYYFHEDFNQAFFITWKPKFELRFAGIIDIHAIPGVGYAHSFPTQATYRLKNGKYQQRAHWGKPHFMPSLGFGGGLHLENWLDVPITTFVRYETFSLAPYAPKAAIPLTLHTMLSFGVVYSFN
ncbi:MAG: hypothetical protein AB3N16_01810 [Flavobacteriaceae bacterium]